MGLAHDVAKRVENFPVTWGEAFPWLGQFSRWSKYNNAKEGAVPALAGDLMVESSVIADLILESRDKVPLSVSLPFVPLDFNIERHFSKLARGLLTPVSLVVFGDIAEQTPSRLLEEYKAGGPDTVSLLPELVLENISAYVDIFTKSEFLDENGQEGKQSDLDIVIQYIREAAGVPENVREAASRLSGTLTEETEPDLAWAIQDFVETLSPREQNVLRRRIVNSSPETLQAIADIEKVTRERIRQIENIVWGKVAKFLSSSVEAVIAKRQMSDAVAPLISVSRFEASHPSLCSYIESLELPAWRVLDLLDQEIEADASWIAAPSLQSAKSTFEILVADNSEIPGAISAARLGELVAQFPAMSATDLAAYAKDLGFTEVSGLLVEPARRSVNDFAEIILLSAGEAMASEQIHAQLPFERSISSLRNALLSDPRFVRVAPNSYALTEWGGSEFLGIRAEIIKRLEVQGELVLSDVMDELSSTFGVAKGSVLAYASTWPLEVVDGKVRKALARPVHKMRLDRTSRVYKKPHGASIRFKVNFDHLRGSGTVLSNQFGLALGLREGESLDFTTEANTVAVRWGQQTQLGSIKSLLEKCKIGEGEEILLDAVAGSISIRKINSTGVTGLNALAKILGIEAADNQSETANRLGLAIGLEPGAGITEVEQCLLRRGEADLAAVIHVDPEGFSGEAE